MNWRQWFQREPSVPPALPEATQEDYARAERNFRGAHPRLTEADLGRIASIGLLIQPSPNETMDQFLARLLVIYQRARGE